MTDYAKLIEQVHSCFLGVRIGDSMGMPWETMSRKQIVKQWNGWFCDPQQRKVEDTKHLRMYDTTDDWQLTEAIARSIIRKRGIDIEDIALAHVEAYQTSTAGWGKTTKRALAQYERWFDTEGREGWDPQWGNPDLHSPMCGSGVVMKIAPVAMFHAIRRDPFDSARRSIEKIANLTHVHPVAYTSAVDYAAFIYDAMLGKYADPHSLLEPEGDTPIERAYAAKIRWVWSMRAKGMHPDEAAIVLGSSFHCYDIVPGAVYCGLRYDDPWKAVTEAILIGGDTDTTASLAGALSGVRNPGKWKDNPIYPSCYDDTEAFAREFYAACL